MNEQEKQALMDEAVAIAAELPEEVHGQLQLMDMIRMYQRVLSRREVFAPLENAVMWDAFRATVEEAVEAI